jgi:hypothetical protein
VLLSFVAKESITLGTAVRISPTTSGQIIPANPSGDYPTYVVELNQLGYASSYLTQLGVAVSSTSLRVNATEPILVVSGFL